MSIRSRIIISMVVVAVVCSIALGFQYIVSMVSFTGMFNDRLLNDAHNLAAALLTQNSEDAERASSLVAESEGLVNALEDYYSSGSRDEMVLTSVALMKATGVDFLTVLDNEGTVLVRAHEPDNFGDSLANQANIKSAMKGKQYTTTEKGTAVKLSVRSGTPILNNDNEQIGVISLGFRLDQSGFVDYISKMAGTHATVFLGDERVSTTIVDDKGERIVGTKASDAVSSAVLAGDDYIGRVNVAGEKLYAFYSPIRDVEGTILGMLFVALDTSANDSLMMRNILVMCVSAAVILVLSIFGALLIAIKITRPIREMASAAKRLAEGDLDVDIGISSSTATKNVTVHLAMAFKEMIKTNRERANVIKSVAGGDLSVDIHPRSDKDVVGIALAELLKKNNLSFADMTKAAEHLDMASSQIADSAQNLANGASEQAATIERLHATIHTLSQRTAENSGHAKQAASLGDNVKLLAEKGSQQMNQMMDAVDQISKASEAIGNVIKVIDDIAFQTNILALNAAVEAARAGQHGKGFAVVAEEVRNLAAKSAEAAKDTGALIANSIEKAKLGAQISADTASSFADIVGGVNETSVLVEEIAEFMQTQNTDIDIITHGVDEINSVIHSVSAAAEQSAAASEEMSSQAATMSESLSEYKLRATKPGLHSANRLAMPPKRD